MRPAELPDEVCVRWAMGAVSVAIAAMLLLYAFGCSPFNPVAEQEAVVPVLPRGGIAVFDINDGLPLISTPHRMVVWRDENGEYHYAPETSEPNVFTALENLPATAGGMLQSTGGAAIGAH